MPRFSASVAPILSFVMTGALAAGCNDHSSGPAYLVDDGGPPVGGCAAITSCAQCTPVRGCGWCTIGGVGRCARGPNECSPNGSYSWTWVPEGCPGAVGDGGVPGDGATGDGATASDASVGSATNFKSASADNVMAQAGVTNLAALSLTAPAAGSIWVSASGTCAVVAALPVDTIAEIDIETDPTANTPTPGAARLSFPASTTGSSQSFSVTQTLAAHAGVNSLYVNFNNPASGGRLTCSTAMTAFFTPQQLP